MLSKLYLGMHLTVAFSQHSLQLPHTFLDEGGRKEGVRDRERERGIEKRGERRKREKRRGEKRQRRGETDLAC